MTSKSKSKGNSGERLIADFLGELFGGNFMRVPNSGAYTGGMNNVRKKFMSESQIRNFKGDIIPNDDLPKMVIESKNYKDFPFHAFLSKEPIKKLEEWISQTLDCVDSTDIWFLIVKINRKGTFVLFDFKLKDEFILDNYSVYRNYIVTDFKQTFIQNKEKIQFLCS